MSLSGLLLSSISPIPDRVPINLAFLYPPAPCSRFSRHSQSQLDLEIVAVVIHTTTHTAHSSHAAHSAHATTHSTHSAAHASGHARHRRRLFRLLGDSSFCGEHHRRCTRCVLQRRAHHLRRIEHARLHEIFVNFARGIESVIVLAFEHRVQHDFRLMSRVARNLL